MFERAISQLETDKKSCSDPMSFQKYLEINGKQARNTAQHISVDSMDRLSPELRQAGYMVFRLGIPENEKNTHFALAKYQTDWADYFLEDDSIFENNNVEAYIPPISLRQLFVFHLLPDFAESSAINLAISSGLLSAALNMDQTDQIAAPATGKGTFTFKLKPFPEALITWQHNKGQVEIDAMFIGKRKGKEILFVVEAKTSLKFGSLAKHKLVYPILAISNKIPSSIPIIPVYIRALKLDGGLQFHVAECRLPDVRKRLIAISELKVENTRSLALLGLNL